MARERETLSLAEQERWTQVGMLAALAMVLGYLETFVPIPIPGVKLGLANIAVLLALAQRDVPGAFCVGAIKVLATGLLFGNPVTLAYSALGTLLAFGVMAPLSRIRGLSIVLVSMAGALAHEAGQLLVAWVLLGTPLVWYSAPVLAVAGCITGALCGVIAARAMHHPADNGATLAAGPNDGTPFAPARVAPLVHVNPKVLVAAFIVYCVVMLRLSSPFALGVALACALVACVLGRVKVSTVAKAVRPTLAIIVITVIAQVASNQYGDVVFSVGSVNVTAWAIEQSGIMVARFMGLMAASVAVMHLASTDDLVGTISWLLSPLERLGMHTAGFTLALNVALGAVPAIVAAAEQQDWNWRDLRDTAPAFVARIYRSSSTE